MSKVDAMRALREARYARTAVPPKTSAATAAGAARPISGPVPAAEAARAAKPPQAQAAGDQCGHRSIGGKHCSRPAGHSEQNHRYAVRA